MSSTSIIGLQWGDEAKGKIVDLLSPQHDIVVRYLGGNNAGHTVVCNGETYKLSLLPSGILHEKQKSVIAAGVVINPKAFFEELDALVNRGVDVSGRLLISDRAHLIFPYHMMEESILEESLKDDAIGTTMRGIGPCYQDKAGRTHAIRMGDLIRPEYFQKKLQAVITYKNRLLKGLNPDFEGLDFDSILEEYRAYAKRFQPYVINTTAFLHDALDNGKRLIFEGAQGSMLDVDHGTFPFVTSSNSSGCGIHAGSGVPEKHISKMIGVVKSYSTRVGGGPFTTELENETGQLIRDTGKEYGTVTGRPRRCGWFDAVAVRYTAKLSGVDCIAVTLLDVLSVLDEIQICEAYEIDGKRTMHMPSHLTDLEKIKPIYRTLPGWKTDITHIRKYADLPEEAKHYIATVSELVGSPVELVSVGPDREQTIVDCQESPAFVSTG